MNKRWSEKLLTFQLRWAKTTLFQEFKTQSIVYIILFLAIIL